MLVGTVKILLLLRLGNARDMWRPELNFAGHRTRLFESHKTGTVPAGKPGLSWEDKRDN